MQKLCPDPGQINYLIKITNSAQQKYLKESRIKDHQSSFNILRILSSFKQITAENMTTQLRSNIYNWILLIIKYFNPKTYEEWIISIKDISLRSQYSSNNSQYHMSKNSSSGNLQDTRSKFQHHKTKNHTVINEIYNLSENQDLITENFNQTGNIQKFYRNNRSCVIKGAPHRQQLINEKRKNPNIHYISFDPEQNKQNNYLEDNRPTKTPFSRSFIHNLPGNSNISPFMLSKVTQNNTKDITTVDEDDSFLQWKNMLVRADIFYGINSKMKAFSALIAASEVFGEYREMINKARSFYKHNKCGSAISSWRAYAHYKKEQRKLENIMAIYHEQKLSRKIFQVLIVIRQLKISHLIQRTKKCETNSYNTHNFLFMNFLLFHSQENCLGTSRASITSNFDPSKSISTKLQYFQETFDAQKMQLLVDNFSKSKFNPEEIQNFYNLYRKAYLRKCFIALSKNVAKKDQKIAKCEQIILKNHTKKFIQNLKDNLHKASEKCVIQKLTNRKMKEKIFKILFQITVSSKLYCKREEYLIKKSKLNTKKNIITQWRARNYRKLQNKVNLTVRVKNCTEIISNIFRKKTLAILLNLYQSEIRQEEQASDHYNISLLLSAFKKIRERVIERKKYCQIKNKQKLTQCKAIFNVWQQKTKIQKFKKVLSKFIVNRVLQTLKYEHQLSLKLENLMNIKTEQIYIKGLKQLKYYRLFQQKKQDIKISQIKKNIIKKNSFIQFTNITSNQIKIRKIETIEKNNQQCMKQLMTTIMINRCKIVLETFKQLKQQRQSLLQKQKNIKEVLNPEGFMEIAFDNNKNYHNMKENKIILRNPISCKRNFLSQLSQNLQMKKKEEQMLLLRMRWAFGTFCDRMQSTIKIRKIFQQVRNLRLNKMKKSNGKQLLKIIKNNFVQQQDKYDYGRRIYNKKLMYDAFVGLIGKNIDTVQKMTSIKNIILKGKKETSFKILIKRMKTQKSFKVYQDKMKKFLATSLFKKQLEFSRCQKVINQKCKEITYRQKRLAILNVLDKLQDNCEHLLMENNLEQAEMICRKKIGFIRIENSLIRNVLLKKSVYMSMKYRAMKLCRNSFNAIKNLKSCKQQSIQNSYLYIRDQLKEKSGFKLYQHISTEYNSL